MALLKCLECGKKVSTEATSCPNCGGPPPKSRKGEKITAKEASKMPRKEVNAFIEAGGTIVYNQKKAFLVVAFIIISVILIAKFGNKIEPAHIEPQVPSVPAIPSPDQYWVVSDKAETRTCPSASCGSSGALVFREGAKILETKNGWVRITEPYNASCVNNKSEYIKNGNANCTKENGIENGKFSEWVQLNQLSKTRPNQPGANATGTEALIKDSDEFQKYKKQFVIATEQLIKEHRCTAKDFQETGGWLQATTYKEPVYFVMCGGVSQSNKVHLNVSNGKIF